MRLRTTLVLAFAALSALQLVAVVPLALRSLNQTLSRQLDTRIDGVMSAARTVLDRTSADASRAMDELVQSEALENIAGDPRRADAGSMAQSARELMIPRGLSVLSLFDSRGVTLSSGHLPARLGDPDPLLFAVTAAPGQKPVPVLVELRDETGLRKVPALVTARPLDYGDERLWAVGGVLLDLSLAQHLSNLTGARVELTADDGRLSAGAGEARPPTIRRELAFPPAATLALHFSRADLLATERQVLLAFLAFVGLGLAIAAIAGFFVARRITRPVEALTAAATAVASGALDARVAEKAAGEVGALVVAFNRMTSDLKAKTEQLVASERIAAWQEVARRLAHEIKNPLTPIKMSLETLMAAGSADHPRFRPLFLESAGAVLEEVERLRRIVDEFSRFARLPKPVLASVDLSELATQVLTLYASPPAGVTLRSELPPGRVVSADRDQLTQVLVNLIKNAEEAIPGGGTIEVRVRDDGSFAVLEVEDSGPGIKPEDRTRIFEPYFTTKQGGTGLGLAIAARICQEHGGRLEAGGAPGRGALFAIHLPRLSAR